MKPFLSLELVHGPAVATPRAAPAASPTEDLAHRPVHIVSANGEGLDAPVPTRGTALLQHGFKEWSGACGLSVVAPCGVRPDASGADDLALWQTLQDCEAHNRTPLLVCRNLEAPLHVLQQMQAEGECALLALGSPLALRLAPRTADLAASCFPVRLPWGIAPDHCLWLGAPPGLPTPAMTLPTGLRCSSHELGPRQLMSSLGELGARVCRLGPLSLWCVVFLDDVNLGPAAERSAARPDSLPAEAVAATLRWLQQIAPWVVVCLVSHERVTPSQRGAVADLARHLGRALYRHPGLARVAQGIGSAAANR